MSLLFARQQCGIKRYIYEALSLEQDIYSPLHACKASYGTTLGTFNNLHSLVQ